MAVPPVIASVLSWLCLFFFVGKPKLKKILYSARVFIKVFLILLCFGVIISLFKYLEYINLRALVFYFLGLGIGIFSIYLFLYEKTTFAKAVRYVLIAHLIAFFIQVFFSYTGIAVIDYLAPVTGEKQRFFGGDYYVGSSRIMRGTGLYNEPGTFSAFIMIIYVLKKHLEGFLFENVKFYLLDFFVFLAVMLSFSTLGYAMLFSYFILTFIRGRIIQFIFLIPIVSTIFIFAWNYYFSVRFLGGSNGTGIQFRADAISEYLKLISSDPILLLLGIGGFTVLPESIISLYSWSDLSLFFNILRIFGVSGVVLLFFSIFFTKKISYSLVVLFFIFGLSKIHPGIMFFWLIISILIFSDKKYSVL